MTIRRVMDFRDRDEGSGHYVIQPDGGHVLLTVEEYRGRIAMAYGDGELNGRRNGLAVYTWKNSDTKRQLDADLGGGHE